MKRGFRIATWDEIRYYGQQGCHDRKLLPPISGGAPSVASLVGATSAVVTGTTAQTPTWGSGANRGQNNVGIAWVVQFGSSTAPSMSGGWGFPQTSSSATVWCGIGRVKLTGGDAAPTITPGGGTIFAMIAEFTGINPTNKDEGSSATGTTGTLVQTASAADLNVGELWVGVEGAVYSSAATKTLSQNFNNAPGLLINVTNNATSIVNHYCFSAAVSTSNGVAWSSTASQTTTNLTAARVAGVTFLTSVQQTPTVVGQATFAAVR